MGDNRKKIYNKNRDKARTDLKLSQKRRWEFYATDEANIERIYRINVLVPQRNCPSYNQFYPLLGHEHSEQ
jgi:hypothetical protein